MQKLIIFDCDGVLVDSEPLSNRVIAEQMNELGIEMDTQKAIQLFAGGSLQRVADYVKDQTGQNAPNDFEDIYRQRSYALFEKELQAVSGISKVLEEMDYQKCVASNGPLPKMKLNLKITGLLHFFENRMFSAYEIGRWKPDPALFLHAAETMGFTPADCIVVEDSIHGVEAAKAAGMQVLAYAAHDHQDKLKNSGIRSFHFMFDLLDLLNDL